MSNYDEESISVDNLLLDPNNYRFQDRAEFVPAEQERFHEESVQRRAERRLRDEELTVLKDSIIRNGLIPIEKIVVRKYLQKDGKYLVVEGNRRVAALKWIQADHLDGVAVSDEILASTKAVPCVIVTEGDEVPPFHEALMGIRHVSGIRQWGGYQRAKLIAKHRDDYGLSAADVGQRLGLSTQEVNRRYRAFKALEQMKDSEEYGSFAKPELYPLFNEAAGSPQIRAWLSWDPEKSMFTDEDALEEFYDLITPNQPDDGPSRVGRSGSCTQTHSQRCRLGISRFYVLES